MPSMEVKWMEEAFPLLPNHEIDSGRTDAVIQMGWLVAAAQVKRRLELEYYIDEADAG